MQQGARFHRIVQQHRLGLPVERLAPLAQEADFSPWWENYLGFSQGGGLQAGWRRCDLLSRDHPHRPPGRSPPAAKFDLLAVTPQGRALILDWKTSRKRPRRQWLADRLQTRVYPCLLIQAGAFLNAGKPFLPEKVEMVYWFADFPTSRSASPIPLPPSRLIWITWWRWLLQSSGWIRMIFLSPAMPAVRLLRLPFALRARGTKPALSPGPPSRMGYACSISTRRRDRILNAQTWLEPPRSDAADSTAAGGWASIGGGDACPARHGRGQSARAFLDPAAYTPASSFELPGMQAAVERLRQAPARGRQSACGAISTWMGRPPPPCWSPRCAAWEQK